MSPEQLKHLLQQYGKTWALVDSQERTYGHAGTDNLARKSTLESQILSLFVEAEEGARRERAELCEWLTERMRMIEETRPPGLYREGMIDNCNHVLREVEGRSK